MRFRKVDPFLPDFNGDPAEVLAVLQSDHHGQPERRVRVRVRSDVMCSVES